MRFTITKALIEPKLVLHFTLPDGRQAATLADLTEDEYGRMDETLVQKLSDAVDSLLIFASEPQEQQAVEISG